MHHTPGPWTVDPVWGLINHGKTEICALHSGNAANARLIAAAPALLEALLNLVRDNYGQPKGVHVPALDAARAAIAKATGETR